MSQRSSRSVQMSQQQQQAQDDGEIPGTSRQPRRQRSLAASQAARLVEGAGNESFALSQPSQKSRAQDLSQIQENNLVGHLVKCILLADRSKIPIQRTYLIKKGLPNHGKHFRHIIGKVQTTLKELFGYNLIAIDGTKYILSNNMDIEEDFFESTKSKKSDVVLLFILLAHIFMCTEQTCSENEIFDLLSRLQVVGEDIPVHEYFGDVEHLVTGKFVEQRYLNVRNVDDSDPPVRQFKWGVRAELELSPRSVLKFVSKIFDNQPMSTWPEQCRIVEQMGNE